MRWCSGTLLQATTTQKMAASCDLVHHTMTGMGYPGTGQLVILIARQGRSHSPKKTVITCLMPEKTMDGRHRSHPRLLLPAWREAAVFGALWGAGEITIGSFLHATRVPLSGVILSAAGVALLTAAMMLTRRPWFPLRTAFVCAALRSLSPEGLVPGPMFAILLQGLLVSLAFVVFRKPLIAGLISGSLAAIASQLQSIVVKLIYYGGELWELFTSFVQKAEGFLHLPPGYGWFAVSAYLLLTALVGGAGGVLGWRIGHMAKEIKDRRIEEPL